MNDYIAFSAYFGVALTLLVYLFACRLGKRLHHPLANPMLLCLIMMIALLLFLDIDYDAYNQSAGYLTYLLTPEGKVAKQFLGPVTAHEIEAAITAAGGAGKA